MTALSGPQFNFSGLLPSDGEGLLVSLLVKFQHHQHQQLEMCRRSSSLEIKLLKN